MGEQDHLFQSGTLGLVFKIFAFVPLFTGIVGWCAVYALLGFSTCPRAPDAPTGAGAAR